MCRQTPILERIITPRRGGFSTEHARYVRSLDFTPAEQRKYVKFSQKAQLGKLTAKERTLLDDLLTVNAWFVILQSKARVSLKNNLAA